MIIKGILKNWGLESLIISLFILVIVPYGAGITFDSISFFQAGDNFWSSVRYVHYNGNGNLEFAAHRFPLYPLLISVFRWIDPSLLAFQIILWITFLGIFRRFIKVLEVPNYFLLLLLTFPVFLNFYAVWTESLYIVLFIILLSKLYKEEKFQSMVWIAIVVGLLCLTKMVGIVVAASLLMAYLIDKRPLRGFLLFASGILVILGWTLLGTFHLGETARSVEIHFVNTNDIRLLILELGTWLTPVSSELIPLITGFVVLVLPLIVILKSWKVRQNSGVLHWFLLLHFYAYLIFVILSKSILDASIAFDQRTLFPLIINFIVILIVLSRSGVLSKSQKRKVKFIFPKVILICVILNASSIWRLRENGLGYNGRDWQAFEFVGQIMDTDSDLSFTNDQAALYYFAPKATQPVLLPQKMDLYSQEEISTYTAEMDLMMSSLQSSRNGKIIWIRNGITGSVFPTYEELKENSNLEIVYDDWLCLILEARN
jgi:hypothetical protein